MPKIATVPSAGPEPTRPAPLGLASAPFLAAAEFLGEQADAVLGARAAEAAALRETQFATVQAGIVSSLRAREVEATELEDANTIAATTVEAGRADVDGLMESVQDDIVRSELERTLPGTLADFEFNAQTIQRGRQKSDYRAAMPDIIKTYTDSIAAAIETGNDPQAESLRLELRSTIEGSPHHGPEEIEKMLHGVETGLDLANANRHMEESPEFLATASPEELRVLMPALDTLKLQEIQATAKQRAGDEKISDVEVAVAEATSIAELDGYRARTESLRADNWIQPPKRTQVLKQIIARRRAIVKDTGDMTLFDDYMNQRAFAWGADAQKVVDQGYQNLVMQSGAQTIEDLHELDLRVIGGTRLVPKQVSDRLNGVTQSNNIQLIEAEAQFFDEIHQLAPQVIKQIGDPARMILENVAEARKTGASAQTVIEQTREFLKLDPSTQKDYEVRYDDAIGNAPAEEWLASKLGGGGFFSALGFGGDTAPVPISVVGPFSTRAHAWFLKDPASGIERAYERTFEDMDDQWGMNNVGKTQFQAYPPVKVYKEWEGDEGAMFEQLLDDVVSAPEQLPDAIIAEIAGDEDVSGIFGLEPGPRTRALREHEIMNAEKVREYLQDRVFITSDGDSGREYGKVPTVDSETGAIVDGAERLTPGYRVWFQPDEGDPIQWTQDDVPRRWYPSLYESAKGLQIRDNYAEGLAQASINRELTAQRRAGVREPNALIAAGDAIKGILGSVADGMDELRAENIIRIDPPLYDWGNLSEGEKDMALAAFGAADSTLTALREENRVKIRPALYDWGNLSESEKTVVLQLGNGIKAKWNRMVQESLDSGQPHMEWNSFSKQEIEAIKRIFRPFRDWPAGRRR